MGLSHSFMKMKFVSVCTNGAAVDTEVYSGVPK